MTIGITHTLERSAPSPSDRASRRGVTMLAFVAAMLVIGAMALWLAQVAGVCGVNYLGHFLSSGSFYAAESGNELAMLELKLSADVDGNAVVGTISNAPALPNGSFVVTVTGSKYTSVGTWNNHKRITETTLQ